MVFERMILFVFIFFFKQKTAYEMRISDWSSDVCSSDLLHRAAHRGALVQLDAGGEIGFAVRRAIVDGDGNGIEVRQQDDAPDAGDGAGVDGDGEAALVLRDLREADLHPRIEADRIVAEQQLRMGFPHRRTQRVGGPGCARPRPPREQGQGHGCAASPFHVLLRSEEHTSELQSLMRTSYAVFCLKKKKK